MQKQFDVTYTNVYESTFVDIIFFKTDYIEYWLLLLVV